VNFRLILLLSVVILSATGVTVSAQQSNRSVYVDPFFGGTEKGPLIAHNDSAKKITLDAAQMLKRLLEEKKIAAILSRDQDVLMSLDERVVKARMRGSSVYVAINLSKTDKDCIWLYYLQQTESKPQKKKKSVGASLDNLLLQDRIKESGQLAERIYSSLKQKLVPLCLEKQSGSKKFESNYVLENASSPVVIIDFGVSDSASPYVLDSVLMGKIISAVSDGIKDYFTASQPNR
jgi:N-acetylmuramoyl-L-alanine amidase